MRHPWTLILLAACSADPALEHADTAAAPLADAAVGSSLCTWTYEALDGAPLPPLAAQVDALAGHPRTATLRWLEDDAVTTLRIELRDPTAYVRGEPRSPDCEPHVLADATVALSTDDGLLDEVLAVTVRSERGRVRMQHWLPLDELAGAWEPSAPRSEWESADLEIAAELTDREVSGALTMYAVRTNDGRQDITETLVATWY